MKLRHLGDLTLWSVEISNQTYWVLNSDSYFTAISWNVTIKMWVLRQSYLFTIAFYNIYVANSLCDSLRCHYRWYPKGNKVIIYCSYSLCFFISIEKSNRRKAILHSCRNLTLYLPCKLMEWFLQVKNTGQRVHANFQ